VCETGALTVTKPYLENVEVAVEMQRQFERRGLDGDTLLKWAAWRVSHNGPCDGAERFLLLLADEEYLARIAVRNRKLLSAAIGLK
jgi:hypothetical protein